MKTFKQWADTSQVIAVSELTDDELKYVTMLPDTIEVLIYDGGFLIQVSEKGIFSYNKEFISMSLLEVEKFIFNHYAKNL